jgi:Uncharacterized protein involved in cysteine biosynthesis
MSYGLAACKACSLQGLNGEVPSRNFLMVNRLLLGAGYLFEGFRLIAQPGVKRFVLMPALINIGVFTVLIWYGATQFGTLIEWLLPSWLNWLRWVLWPLFASGALLVTFYTFTLIGNLIGTPFNSLLADRVEAHLRGKTSAQPLVWTRLPGSLLTNLAQEGKKLVYFVSQAVPLLLLFLVPVLNIAVPFLWLAFSAWMMALAYLDYPVGTMA